ncbi:uncharacterized protein METZ01_LOCUS484316, partial [marine metagenome]
MPAQRQRQQEGRYRWILLLQVQRQVRGQV